MADRVLLSLATSLYASVRRYQDVHRLIGEEFEHSVHRRQASIKIRHHMPADSINISSSLLQAVRERCCCCLFPRWQPAGRLAFGIPRVKLSPELIHSTVWRLVSRAALYLQRAELASVSWPNPGQPITTSRPARGSVPLSESRSGFWTAWPPPCLKDCRLGCRPVQHPCISIHEWPGARAAVAVLELLRGAGPQQHSVHQACRRDRAG